MRIIKTIGNQDLLQMEKTLFLCLKRTPIEFETISFFPKVSFVSLKYIVSLQIIPW